LCRYAGRPYLSPCAGLRRVKLPLRLNIKDFPELSYLFELIESYQAIHNNLAAILSNLFAVIGA
jgi:hypothetical protein